MCDVVDKTLLASLRPPPGTSMNDYHLYTAGIGLMARLIVEHPELAGPLASRFLEYMGELEADALAEVIDHCYQQVLDVS